VTTVPASSAPVSVTEPGTFEMETCTPHRQTEGRHTQRPTQLSERNATAHPQRRGWGEQQWAKTAGDGP
jgi:hypothetical protein